jgi:hypothetical protein
VVSKFEAELARHLRPAAAPEELWDRIQRTGRGGRRARLSWPVWALAAAAAALALFCLSLRSDTTPYLAKAAAGELTGGSERVDLHSHNAAEIQAWAKRAAGLDIPLAAGPGVQLLGAKLIRDGGMSVCVSYRVGNHDGKLLVARGPSGALQHAAPQPAFHGGTALAFWAVGDQIYAMAAPDAQDLQAACVLCHVGGAARKISPRA